jgi:hypothetical protein
VTTVSKGQTQSVTSEVTESGNVVSSGGTLIVNSTPSFDALPLARRFHVRRRPASDRG